MPQPQLGYGHQTEATIDQVNQWMRSQPWWQQIKGGSNDISEAQKQQILAAARAQGVVVDSSNMEVDKAGNFNPIGHKLRNGIIVAGIAGAAIAAPYLIPAMTGGGGAAGGGAAAAGALGPSTAANMAATAGIVGGGAVPAGIAAGAGGAGAAGLGTAGWLKTAGNVADALGGMSTARAAGRQAENQAAYLGDRNIIDLYKAQQDAAANRNTIDLSQKKFTLEAPQLRASNSVRGDVLANAQDATVSGISPNIPVPTISGGLRPSMFSQNTRALGGLMSEQALASQKSGDTFSPLPDTTAPSLTPVSQPGKLDTFLNTASSIGSLASLIPYARRQKKPVAYDNLFNTGSN